MPTIHALMVGINAYPTNPLSGCLNDVKAMEAYLRKMYHGLPGTQLRISRITDEDVVNPTRQNIIDGFSIFGEAQPGDLCLFYFSGHGSFTKAPDEFWTETDGNVESFVCLDSRLPGGRDLVNKEMGFLIAKALEGKSGVLFVAITDCCHSGTITKAFAENKWKERSFAADFTPRSLQDYFGYNQSINGKPAYEVSLANGKKRVTVQQAPHLHLAAAQADQTAKELMIDGAQHGAFTYSLLKSLYSNNGLISYQKLVASAAIQVAGLVQSQHPIVHANGGLSDAELRRYFFLDKVDPAAQSYRVYWNKKAGWCVDAGIIHGASVGDKVVIDGVCETLIIDEPAPGFSVLMSKPQMGNGSKDYSAKLVVQPGQKTKISFAEGFPSATRAMIEDAYRKQNPVYLEISTSAQAKYYIRHGDKGVFLALPNGDLPVFDYVNIQLDAEAFSFLDKVAAVANWLHLLETNNPSTTIRETDYQIHITRSTLPGNFNPSTFEPVADISKPIDLFYRQGDQKLEQPAFQIVLTNTGSHNLWFNCLSLEFDYSIETGFVKGVKLEPGQSVALRVIEKQVETDVIKWKLDKKYIEKGYSEITDYLKLFISTHPLDVSKFSQKGLELAPAAKNLVGMAKSIGTEKPRGSGTEDDDEPQNDWKTETIALHIVRPSEGVNIEAGKVTVLNGISIEPHSGFSAQVSLTSSCLANGQSKSLAAQPLGRAALEPFSLLPQTRGAAVMDTLELFDVSNAETVTAENPLVVQLPASRSGTQEVSIPMGVDAETGLLYPLGFTDEANRVVIEHLPEPSPSTGAVTSKSLLGSIKLYFKKVAGSWLGLKRDNHRLAEPYIKDGEVKYHEDEKVEEENKLVAKVQNAKAVLLLVHGIIGDTRGMVQSLKTVLDDQGTTPDKAVDLVLTFDYENLGTPIEETAAALKDALGGVGLKEGHGKKLVIAAHSMGGLVSRVFIEKLGGDKVVSHLVMYGTPNRGTPWVNVRDMAQAIITYGVNGAAFLQPYLFALSAIGKIAQGTQRTFAQMHPDTGIYQTLNDGNSAPAIGYTIISGNTQDIVPGYVKTGSLISRIFSKAKRTGYSALDDVLFKKPNDIAVSVESIEGIPGSEGWQVPPVRFSVACDHLNYFSTKEALKHLRGEVG